MILKFSYATIVALASVTTMTPPTTTHAFLFSATHTEVSTGWSRRRCASSSSSSSSLDMVGSWNNDGFLEALSGGGDQPPDEDEDEEPRDGDQGGSRLKHIMAKAQQSSIPSERGFHPIENPFLTPPPFSPPIDPEELTLEEQARRFRQMMQNGGGELPPQSRRTARTDRAGRPLGRNRDADTIANAADLYFAQLKRDSSVRGVARMRGEDEKAGKVFADEGIKELESLMYENPYLKGQRDKERQFIDAIPEEFVRPYFDPDMLPENEKTTSGISYRELMKQRKQNKGGNIPKVQNQVVHPPPQQPSNMGPPQLPAPKPVVPQPGVSQPSGLQSVMSSSDQSKSRMRTLMGMLLKHRGGPGFGKGRLSGREIDQFNNLLQEVLGMLQVEATQSTAATTSSLTQVSVTPQQSFSARPVVPVSVPVTPNAPSQLDSMIACVDGAIKMYKNCPPELQGSVLSTLRAALSSAVNTCDGVIGFPDLNPAPVMSQVEGTIAVIEGAVMMYKNSPPELQPSVLMTLRSAFRAAVSTYDVMLGGVPVQQIMPATPLAPVASTAQPATPSTPQQLSNGAFDAGPAATDPNSKVLDDIYNTMKGAAGDGSLGLRSDLSSEEASELAEKLMGMRKVLMDELDAGIPDPEPVALATPKSVTSDSSTVSKYQQMLAKAKADKASGIL